MKRLISCFTCTVLCLGVMDSRAEAVPAAVFGEAVPVWHKGNETTLNEQLLFTGKFVWRAGEELPVLRLASPYPYRVKLNGMFVWYGPARGPKKFFRVDEVRLSPKAGVNVLEIENAGYNCGSCYIQRQPSFLLASLTCSGRTLLKTSAAPGDGCLPRPWRHA